MLHDPAKTYEHRASSEAQPVRPNIGPSVPETTWLAYLYAAGQLASPTPSGVTDIFGCHRQSSHARVPRDSPLCKLCLENSGSPDRARIPPPSLFGSSPSVSRTLTECLRALTGTSGFHRTPPGVHRTPPGVHRRSIPHGRDFRDPPHDPQQHGQPRLSTGRLRSTNRCVVLATEHPRMLTGTSGFHPSPFGDSPKPVRPHSPFNGDSIVSLQRTTRSKAPGRKVQRLWRHGGHFRVDPRLSSLLSTLDFNGS